MDLELKSTRLEQTLISLLNKKSFLLILGFLFLLIFNYFIFSFWSFTGYPAWSRMNIIQDKYWSSLVILLGSLLIFFLKGKIKTFFLIFIVCASWIFPLHKLNTLNLYNLSPLFFIGLATLVVLKMNFARWVNILILTILYFLLIYGLAFTAISTNNGKTFQYFSTIHSEFLILYFFQLILLKSKDIHFFWNPLQLFSPIPLPATTTEASQKEKKELFISGFLEILKSNMLMFFCFYLLKNITIENVFLNSFFKYFTFIFLITASMSFITGILRLYGFKAISASHFLCLAKSPLETWQRGSVYLAKFTFDFIFFPLWKKTRSTFISSIPVVAFVFFNLFLFHDYLLKAFVVISFPNALTSLPALSALKMQFLWLLLWLVWILIFQFTFNRMVFLKKSAIGNWLLVLLTHLGNMSIIPVSVYLAGI